MWTKRGKKTILNVKKKNLYKSNSFQWTKTSKTLIHKSKNLVKNKATPLWERLSRSWEETESVVDSAWNLGNICWMSPPSLSSIGRRWCKLALIRRWQVCWKMPTFANFNCLLSSVLWCWKRLLLVLSFVTFSTQNSTSQIGKRLTLMPSFNVQQNWIGNNKYFQKLLIR